MVGGCFLGYRVWCLLLLRYGLLVVIGDVAGSSPVIDNFWRADHGTRGGRTLVPVGAAARTRLFLDGEVDATNE